MKNKKQLTMEDKIEKIKMIDLELTPTKYHILFDVDNDWNKGNDSSMSSLERAGFHQLYLEYNRWEMRYKLKLKVSDEQPDIFTGGFAEDENENTIQGFIF
jgi:hypothetical protein